MPTVWLVRHARSTANASGILAGRTTGVMLDDEGVLQLDNLAKSAVDAPIEYVVSSPLERTQQTAQAMADPRGLSVRIDDRLNECDYGSWSGRALKDLAEEPLWSVIQSDPQSVTFPDGESMVAMQDRAIESVEFWKQQTDGLVVLVSHGDVIKSIIAHYAKLDLNDFQGIHVAPANIVRMSFDGSSCTLSSIKYTSKSSRKTEEQIGGGDIDKKHS